MMETPLERLICTTKALEKVSPAVYEDIRDLTWMRETLEDVEYEVDDYGHTAHVDVPDEYIEDVIAGILLRAIRAEDGWVASIEHKNSGKVDITLSASSDVWCSVRSARCLADGLLEVYLTLKGMVGGKEVV